MALRARLGVEFPDGSIQSVYFHSGDALGVEGLAHFDTVEKAQSLVNIGYVSRIFSDGTVDADPERDTTKVALDLEDYIDHTAESDGDYIYLHRDGGGWFGASMHRPTGLMPLADLIEREKARAG